MILARVTSKQIATALSLTTVMTVASSAQTVYHVDDNAAPFGNGLSWANAFDSLDSALTIATDGDQVWVAAGRYKPSVELVPGDPRSVSFEIPNGVDVYGGFAGTETTLAARAGLFAQTSLSGDIGTVHDASDNAYHVVFIDGGNTPSPSRLDGFRVTDGNADGPTLDDRRGGGVRVTFQNGWTPTLHIENCDVSFNNADYGGAIGVNNLGRVLLAASTLTDNTATERGGAVWAISGPVVSTNAVFARNSAKRGGAVFLTGQGIGDPAVFMNCSFYDNSANRGGVAFLGGSQFVAGRGVWINCTLAFNTASIAGGAFRANTSAQNPADLDVYNSIVWGNSAPTEAHFSGGAAVAYSNVQGGVAGTGNIRKDPKFVDEAARNLRLMAGSPSNDAGDNTSIPNDIFDLDGDGITSEPTPVDLQWANRRADDPAAPDKGNGTAPIVDQGAYELNPS